MAVSKILHMKDCGTSFHGRHLKSTINYIIDPDKTQQGRLVSGINCIVDYAYEQMQETKKQFAKNNKRQGYHIILSFKDGETDADTVFEITRRFAEEYLGNDYELVYAVHDNTDHIHSHVVFNSVSFRTGKKYRYEKGDWFKYIQPITNRLCKEYNLSTIDIEAGREEKNENKICKKERYESWKEEKEVKVLWSDMIKRDIDACIIQAASYEGFIDMLIDKGYEVKNTNGEGKYLAIKPPGMQRFKKCKTLGDDYTEEAIRTRIINENIANSYVTEHDVGKVVYCKVKRAKRAKLSNLQIKYYAKLYRIGKLKKKTYSQAWKYKDEIKKMHKYQQQYLFLVRHNIHTIEDLLSVNENLLDDKKIVNTNKSKVYKARAKYNELFAIYDEMKDIEVCEKCYEGGDKSFEEEHIKWKELEDKLKKQGYSYSEVENIKAYYKNEIAKIRECETNNRRELRIAKELIKDNIVKNEEAREENVVQDKDENKIDKNKEFKLDYKSNENIEKGIYNKSRY